MRAKPEDTAALRLYLIVGAFTGAATGSVMVGTLGLPDGWARTVWLVLCGLVGAGVGWLFVLAQRPEPPRRTAAMSGDQDAADASSDTDTSSVRRRSQRLVAIKSQDTSTTLRAVAVEAHPAPMAPPEIDLQILIEDCDHTEHIGVADGSLAELTPGELRDRVITEVHRTAPVPDGAADFKLVAYRSEGPVDDLGRCEHGFTFYLFDGARGLRCAATTTRHEISLQFTSVSTWPRPVWDTWIDPAAAITTARAATDGWSDAELWLRVDLPVDVLVFTREPLCIADVDVEGGGVRNLSSLRQQLAEPARTPGERFALDDVTAWFRAEELSADGDFGAAIASDNFAQGLRTLDDDALHRAAMGLWRAAGPDVTEAIAQALADAPSTEESVELLHLVARLPSGLSAAILQRVSLDSGHDDVRTVADVLFGRRRRGELGVDPDPLASLDFEASRLAMGKTGLRAIALKSTYDPERDLFGRLSELGLQVTRARVLCGEDGLHISTWLRPSRGDTEVLVASTPLPVPCHVLHVIGSGADTFAQRIIDSDIAYDDDAIIADAMSTSPHSAHRAALYISALRMVVRGVASSLADAWRRGHRDPHLRRAILRAMEYVDDPGADAFLVARREAGDAEERSVSVSILARRAALRDTLPATPRDAENAPTRDMP